MAFLLAAGVLALVAVTSQARLIGESLRRLGPGWPLLALACLVLGLLATAMAWRTLLADLGSRLPVSVAARVFFLGQLGKYLPGSVWAFVGQMELARAHGVPRSRTGAAGLLAVLLSLVTGLGLAALILPFAAATVARSYAWALALGGLLLLALHPRLVNPALDRVLRLAGRQPLEHPLTGRGVLLASAWGLLGWLLFGLHAWVLAVPLGAGSGRGLILALGGFALAWCAGFLVVVAPAGAGVREVVLVATLAPVLDGPPALVVALVSRLLFTVADLLVAAWAAGWRRPQSGTRRTGSAAGPG